MAIVDKRNMVGGVCVNTGTIPSKTFREAVLHLTGYRHQGFYGRSYAPRKNIKFADILQRVNRVVTAEQDVVRVRCIRNDDGMSFGTGRVKESANPPGASLSCLLSFCFPPIDINPTFPSSSSHHSSPPFTHPPSLSPPRFPSSNFIMTGVDS